MPDALRLPCQDMARCFAEVGEAFVGTVVQATPEVSALCATAPCMEQRLPTALRPAPIHRLRGNSPNWQVAALVEAMLDVAGYPEDSIAAISFNFWHSLALALQARGFGSVMVEDAERERRRLVQPSPPFDPLTLSAPVPLSSVIAQPACGVRCGDPAAVPAKQPWNHPIQGGQECEAVRLFRS